MNLAASTIFLLGTITSLVLAYEPYYTRLETQIIRLENPQGIDYQGEPCGGQFNPRQCNTIVSAFVDTDSVKPFHSGADSNGRYGPVEYKVLSVHQDDNDPHINKIISSDICGKSIEKAVVKVRMLEQDANGEKRINDFTCDAPLHSTLYGHPVWSPVQLCQPEYQSRKMRLYFRYRVSQLAEKQCREEFH